MAAIEGPGGWRLEPEEGIAAEGKTQVSLSLFPKMRKAAKA